MRHRAFVSFASLVLVTRVVSAAEDVWRYPEKYPPAEGPAEVTIGASLPAIDVFVHDREGKPVSGLAVWVEAASGKKSLAPQHGATGADGKFLVRGGSGGNASAIRLSFAWEGGARTIRAVLEPKGKKGWQVAEAPYKRILDGKDDGSCKNLFALKPAAGGKSYVLDFRQPLSLLGCEDIAAYGSEKKIGEVGNILSIGQRDVNKGDKNSFTPADETKMGLEASSQFDQQFEQVTDPQIVGYVQKIMEKVVAASDQPKMPVHLRVVHTDDVNAFVTAGGHVYVFTGLIKMAQNESQVAGVLAHEASHSIARHVTEGATRASKAQSGAALGAAGLGALLGLSEDTQALATKGAQTSAGLVTLHFDRKSETEADLLGEQYLWKAGWDPEAIARFFELMQNSGMTASGPNFMSTHPTHEKRVENGILWARAFLPTRDRYLVDTAEFQALKARVKALPPPKKKAAPAGQKSLQQLMAETPTWKGIFTPPAAEPAQN